jgi:hypothetical protein
MKFSIPVKSALLALCLGLAGCGQAEPWEEVVPARGVVTFKGKPIAGAQLTLIPVDPSFPGNVRPTATTSPTGEYTVGTHSAADGAPVGEYKVGIVWHPLVNKGGGPVRGDNVLPQRLANPETSSLKIVIGHADNVIPQINL